MHWFSPSNLGLTENDNEVDQPEPAKKPKAPKPQQPSTSSSNNLKRGPGRPPSTGGASQAKKIKEETVVQEPLPELEHQVQEEYNIPAEPSSEFVDVDEAAAAEDYGNQDYHDAEAMVYEGNPENPSVSTYFRVLLALGKI